LKVVDLPAPFGPMRPDDLPGARLKADVVHRHQPAEGLADGLHVEHHLAGGRLGARGQVPGALPVDAAARPRQAPVDEGPEPVGQVLEHQHDHDAEHDQLVAAGRADELGQQHLQLVFQQLDDARARNGAPHMGRTAEHHHEEVLDAHLQPEGRWVDRALEVRKQPARDGGEHGREHEDADLEAQRVHAHGLGHLRAAGQRADGAAAARVEQPYHRERRKNREEPDDAVEQALLPELEAEQRQAFHAQDAVVLAQRIEVAHEVVQRQRPRDGRQRQVVPRHAQRDRADDRGAQAGQREPDEQRDPGRQPGVHGEVGGGVGPDAHERRLPEGGEAAHAGEQHQAEHGQRVDADVVELDDPEVGQRQQGQGDEHQDQRERAPGAKRALVGRLRFCRVE
jgi:hypothetical protein